MKQKRTVTQSIVWLSAFVVWTVALKLFDVQPIGPNGSVVGLATLNGWFHHLTGVHLSLYTVTDWLGLVPVALGLGFAILGLAQWIRRKTIAKVDKDLLLLGGFYLVVCGAYLLFEYVVINYRPVLIGGNLEVSYPSSTTLLVLCILPTTIWQVCRRIRSKAIRTALTFSLGAFTAFMVIGRLLSGVHWLTDIVGGILLSAALVTAYTALCNPRQPKH